MVKSRDEVLERVDYLTELNEPLQADKQRIQAILDGGAAGIKALLGPNASLPNDDLTTVNLMDSGLRKFAYRLRFVPDCKVDTRVDRDSDRERNRASKRERIVQAMDQASRIELQMPQVGRWLPGYGLAAWIIRERIDLAGNPYPHTELRDSYDVMPGWFGPDQQPSELGVRRMVPAKEIAKIYPEFKVKFSDHMSRATGLVGQGRWESVSRTGIEVIEYFCDDGMYFVVPEHKLVLDWVPNLLSGPPFVVVPRYSFNRLQSHFAHVIGIMSMMAKLNALQLIAAEDSVFRETNIIGEMESEAYDRGRFALNFFAPGTRIEKPQVDQAFNLFQQIDRLERQLRVGAGYPVSSDGQSPMSFATGQGIDRLQEGIDGETAEYQLALKHAFERLDQKRLEWDEKMYGDVEKTVRANVAGNAIVEKYRPGRDIAGDYYTRRVYGVMAGWDEPQKIVTGLQLLQGRIIDRQTMQENLHGLENIQLVNERITQEDLDTHLIELLKQQAMQGDPRATLALVEIRRSPNRRQEILDRHFTPEAPQETPAEQQFLAEQANPMAELFGQGGAGAPPVSTVLSRLESGGAAEGGVQTVGRL